MTEKERRRKAFAYMGKIHHELESKVSTYHICSHCEERAARRDKCYVCLMREVIG